MDARYDIQLDAGNDLEIVSNDVVYDMSDEQHVQDTINASPGWWKENYTDGVGIRSYLNSDGQEQVLARAIKIQLTSDLYTVTNPSVDFDVTGKLIIQPNATS
jgi:hypothetical protein